MLAAAKCLLVLFLAIASAETDAGSGKNFLAYDFLYQEGVKMYLQEDWEGCAMNMELALKGWHWWNDNTASCRKNCSHEAREKELLATHTDEEDRYFEHILHSTLCLIKCKNEAFGPQRDRVVESKVLAEFKDMKPYDYLQLCYYRLGRMNDAANAAATVLAVQPDNEVMSENMRYYLEEGGIDAENVVNLEMKPYAQEYVKATVAYKENNFDLTITHMEHSLKMFLEEYQNCRYMCESPFDQGWFPDFVSSVANHFTFTLRCKRKCLWQLSDLYGEIDDNFLPSYFDYLQYAYFQKGETRKACEALASFLHLNPKDEVQNRNKEFYDSVEEVTQDMFVPRKEVVALKEREDYEEQLMAFIESNFAFLTDEFWDEEDTTEAEQPKSKGMSKEVHNFRSRVVSQLKSLSELGVKAVSGEWERARQDRLVADGLTSTLECMVLTELTRLGAVEGDGYKGGYSPHTPAEAFQGISLGRAGLMVHAGLIDKAALELILRVTDRCRDYIERHFHLSQQLYFAYTHLVCRTAKPEMNHNRSALDLSHEVHADNCILQDSGECLRVPPAYTYRDYSAILYLNDDFEGGEFIFTQDKSGLTYESSVKPQCGRLVGFSSGPENPHGVLPVRKGTRCSVGMWFTHDQRHNEVERTMASLFLKQLNANQI
ncbi:hypothetical protein O3P69_000128 [Scylla paramamosain]|uniref:procollagen-proline 3-dioxygenase n=1 Tax=Scylla paramamosain TaxID=85552 RepID=A0AAW0UUN7_SCYPA